MQNITELMRIELHRLYRARGPKLYRNHGDKPTRPLRPHVGGHLLRRGFVIAYNMDDERDTLSDPTIRHRGYILSAKGEQICAELFGK